MPPGLPGQRAEQGALRCSVWQCAVNAKGRPDAGAPSHVSRSIDGPREGGHARRHPRCAQQYCHSTPGVLIPSTVLVLVCPGAR